MPQTGAPTHYHKSPRSGHPKLSPSSIRLPQPISLALLIFTDVFHRNIPSDWLPGRVQRYSGQG
ncbi:hypothetical protein BGY98DRAFT_958818, partial [Russula aff. rugulosa BPL654]